MVENLYRSSRKVFTFLSDLNKTGILIARFSKNTQVSNFTKIRRGEAGALHIDGQ